MDQSPLWTEWQALQLTAVLKPSSAPGLPATKDSEAAWRAVVFSVQLARSPLEGLLRANSLVKNAIFLKSASLPCPLAMRALRDSFPSNPSSMICSIEREALDLPVEAHPAVRAITAAARTIEGMEKIFTMSL